MVLRPDFDPAADIKLQQATLIKQQQGGSQPSPRARPKASNLKLQSY